MDTIDQLISRFVEAKIDFVIIGGFAGVLHGSDMVTQDIDICATLNAETLQRFRDALRDLNPKHRITSEKISFLEFPKDGSPVNNLYLDTDLGTLDILTNVIGVGDLSRLKAAARTILFQGVPVRVMSIEDLIKSKETLGREKDLLAAKELRAIAAARKQPPQN